MRIKRRPQDEIRLLASARVEGFQQLLAQEQDVDAVFLASDDLALRASARGVVLISFA